MAWVPATISALVLLALLYPLLSPRLRRGRRARKAHRGGVVHLYANYDEDLRYEPLHDDDIMPVSRADFERFGYHPRGESAVVPRTFRGRVAGDEKVRLWSSNDESLRPVWVCTWQSVELPGVAPTTRSVAGLTKEFLKKSGDQDARDVQQGAGAGTHDETPAPSVAGEPPPVC